MKEADDAIMRMYAKGLKSSPLSCAALRATGNMMVTAALLVMAQENTVVAM